VPADVPFFAGADVLRAVSPRDAYAAVESAFVAHARGEWTMPPKVYVTNYPAGDFRAMPALGGGHALLKWVTSFPGNPAKGLPTVTGLVLLSDAETGALVAGGGQENLQRRAGGDDRADVAALGDVVAVLDQSALALDHRRADLRMDRHPGGRAANLGLANPGGDVLTVQRHQGRAQLDPQAPCQLSHGIAVGQVESVTKRRNRDRAIHGPGIEVCEAEALCDGARDRGFARACGSVNCDDHGPNARRSPRTLPGSPFGGAPGRGSQ